MIRRRRPRREIAFSFDSFLDVVANVVGIILRLILMAWVGAQSYTGLVELAPVGSPTQTALPEPAAQPEPTSPLAPGVERLRGDLAVAKVRLHQQTELLDPLREQARRAGEMVEALQGRRRELEGARAALERQGAERAKSAQVLGLSLRELSERSKKLLAEIERARRAPTAKKELRYRTPVSQPVIEELMFECRNGRVTPFDRAGLEEKIWQEVRLRQKEFLHNWEMSGVTPPLGAFRLRWSAERERGLLDAKSATPAESAQYRARLVAYSADPIRAERGETADAALKAGSYFRNLVDPLDPEQTAVTLWVYPDSFALYRRLRDYLHDRDMVVAGRPMPEGSAIGSSQRGTPSRGQ